MDVTLELDMHVDYVPHCIGLDTVTKYIGPIFIVEKLCKCSNEQFAVVLRLTSIDRMVILAEIARELGSGATTTARSRCT